MMSDGAAAVVSCAKPTRVASSDKHSKRHRRGLRFWLVSALVGSTCGTRGVRGQENYDYDYGPPQPPARVGGGEGRGGILGPLAALGGGFGAMKLLISGRRKHKRKQAQIAEEKKWEVMKREDLAQINQQFNQMETSLTASLSEKMAQSKALEQFLYQLPDMNNDGLITRYEFDKYMNEYKKSHPDLTDGDLPRFEEMDHNNNGHINFHEWEEYQLMAMQSMV